MIEKKNGDVSYEIQRQFCPKCEEEKKQPRSIEDTVALIRSTGLTRDQSVSDELYEKRLSACKGCPFLLGGILCSMCGCYIAVRALYSDNECPSPEEDRWINL